MEYGIKATVLDTMNILVDIWGNKGDKYRKYSSTSGVQRCWRKTAFSLSFTVLIDIQFGRDPITEKENNNSKEDCHTLFYMLK